jgi:hypothetical protein
MSATTEAPLAALQSWMQNAIAGADSPASRHTTEHLESTPTLPAEMRLAIYQRSYRLRLLQSFHALFPGLKYALGEDLLDAFALDYLSARPPRHTSINRIADGFVEHLERTRPPGDGKSSWVDFLLDLARIELALLDVSDAPGLEGATRESPSYWRELDAEELWSSRPTLAPCTHLLRCAHPAHEYLQALRREESPAVPGTRAVWLALTRVDFRLSTRELAPVQWELLRRLDGTTSLRDVADTVISLQLRPAPTADLVALWLDNFSAQGIVRISTPISSSFPPITRAPLPPGEGLG